MEPLEMLASLEESMPKIRQFLTESISRASDPDLQTRLAKVIEALEANYGVVRAELPGQLAELNARKAKAESSIRDGIAAMRTVAELKKARVREQREQIRAMRAHDETATAMATPNPARSIDADDPELGRKIREGLLKRYVGSTPAQREAVKPPSFEDWTDSVVQLEIPPASQKADKSGARLSGKASSPHSFESWLDGGSTIAHNEGGESEKGKQQPDDVQKLNQEFLKYVRREENP